jgi:hypothetical protein
VRRWFGEWRGKRERETLEIVLEAGFLNRYRAVVVICRDCLFWLRCGGGSLVLFKGVYCGGGFVFRDPCRVDLGALRDGAGSVFCVCPQCSNGAVAAASAGVGVEVFVLAAVAVAAAGVGVAVFLLAAVASQPLESTSRWRRSALSPSLPAPESGVAVFLLAVVAVVVTGVGTAVSVLAVVAVADARAYVIRVELVVGKVLMFSGVLRPLRVADVYAVSQHDIGEVNEAFAEAAVEGSS